MEVEQALRMNGGVGKHSYASNNSFPRTVISMVRPTLEESITDLYCSIQPECFTMADLGCATGPNTLFLVSEVIDIIELTRQRMNLSPPSLQVFLNDLPGNDFNTIFELLPSFHKKLEEDRKDIFGQCFIAGVPGSFYGRLFPTNSLHFFHSCYALMWLSKVPKELVSETGEALNKGNICIAKTSPSVVIKAYFEQFKRDFKLFLKCRAVEMIHGGHMVISTLGSIRSDDPLTICEPLGLKLNQMVSEGLIPEAKLDSFNLPQYNATMEEVRQVIEEEGSFTVKRMETFNQDWDDYLKKTDSSLGKRERAAIVTSSCRAIIEPILVSHFGGSIMDELFQRFENDVLDYMEAHKCQAISLVISLKKKDKAFPIPT